MEEHPEPNRKTATYLTAFLFGQGVHEDSAAMMLNEAVVRGIDIVGDPLDAEPDGWTITIALNDNIAATIEKALIIMEPNVLSDFFVTIETDHEPEMIARVNAEPLQGKWGLDH
jgi:hypothetical protein